MTLVLMKACLLFEKNQHFQHHKEMSSHFIGSLFSICNIHNALFALKRKRKRKFRTPNQDEDLFSCENRINVMCISNRTLKLCGFILFVHDFATFPSVLVSRKCNRKAFFIQSSNRKYDHRLIIQFHVSFHFPTMQCTKNEDFAHRIHRDKDSTWFFERYQ